MNKLFEKSSINGIVLANRFVRSATWEGLATADGAVTPQLIEKMVELAKGDLGLIISSHIYVSKEGQGGPWQLGLDRDELTPGYQEMTAAVHEYGGKIFAQLTHAGNFTEEKLTGHIPLVVSAFEGLAKTPRKEVSKEDIERLVAAYAAAAQRVQSAGFDGLQFHSAHGYFLSQFLSPAFNKRQDEYGGSLENRMRIHGEIYQAVRNVVGKDYPITIKMNCVDFVDNGLEIADSIRVAQYFSSIGFDAVELSGGFLKNRRLLPSQLGINSPEKEGYFQSYAKQMKEEISIPLILVGGMRSLEIAEKIVADGVADYISMSRPLIREPDLISRWKSGSRQKSACTSDNLCFKPGFVGKGVYCVTKEREEKRAARSE